jgi:hypothetical protein
MWKKIVFILVASFLFVGTSAFAQNNISSTTSIELSSYGITPDSPFYFLKTWKESIQTFFTFGAENKAIQYLRLADVRLAEYRKMMEVGKIEIANKTLDKYEYQLGLSLEKIAEAREGGKDVEKLVRSASTTIAAQQEVFSEVLDKMNGEGLNQAPTIVQDCFKSIFSNIDKKSKGVDPQLLFKDCLPAGTKVPSDGTLNMEALRKMQEFYGSSLSAKDLDSLKKAQEQLKGIIPEGEPLPKTPFNLEDIKNLQRKMQEEENKLSPEDREYINKLREQGPTDDPAPIELQRSGSGMGL